MSTFKERFNAWKEGKSVYKNGLRIAFDEGKDEVQKPIEQDVQEPDLYAALDYARDRKRDVFAMLDKGKDVAGGYHFNAIRQISPNAGLSYGTYYDKLTGDWRMDANRQALPEFRGGKMTTDEFVQTLGPRVYRGLVERGVQHPMRVLKFMMKQLAHESNRGNSRNVRVNNNYAGIGWNPKTKTYTHYDTVDDFVNGYLDLMTGRYAAALNSMSDSDYAAAIRNKGYFTAPLNEYVGGMRAAGDVVTATAAHMENNPNLYFTNAPLEQETPEYDVSYQQPEVPVVTAANRFAGIAPTPRLINPLEQ